MVRASRASRLYDLPRVAFRRGGDAEHAADHDGQPRRR